MSNKYTIYDMVLIIRPQCELIKEGKLFEISGGKFVAAEVCTASAAILRRNKLFQVDLE